MGRTWLTVGTVIELLQLDHGADELFRRFPELDPEDLRDAVDYAARQGLLNGPAVGQKAGRL